MGGKESIGSARAIAVAATSRREIQPITVRGDIPPRMWFAEMCRRLWTRQLAAKSLHFFTDAKERTCRDWSAGAAEPSAGVLACLLRGSDGGRVLELIMVGANAPWWRELCRARIVADAFDASIQRIEQQLELAFD
jgi:hypothetical protein